MINPPKNIQSSPQEMYQLLQDITNHIISWAKPGMKMCELDAEARRMLGEYSEYFTHSLGHGVGIQIHESPRVSGKSAEILEPGMVITIEPGVYGIKIQNREEVHNTQYTIQNEGNSIVTPAKAGVYHVATVMDSRLRGNDGEVVYGLRYEEMVLVDKDKLIVL